MIWLPLSARARINHMSSGPSWQEAVLALSPYSFLRFKETSGSVAYDISGNGNNGAYVNNPTRGGVSLVPSDPSGKSFLTASGPNAATIPCNSGQNGYTYMVAANLGTGSGYGATPVMTRWPSNGAYYMVQAGYVRYNGQNVIDTLGSRYTDSAPHLHIIRTDHAAGLFQQSSENGGGYISLACNTSPASASVGYNYGYNEGPIGSFSESSTWDRLLTDEEVFSLIMAYRGDVVSPSSPSARYWRLYITANQGGDGYINLAQIAFRATAQGYCHGWQSQITTDQSSIYSGYNAHSALKDTNGFYHSASQAPPWWASVDFGRPVSVAELALTGANVAGRQPKDFKIQSSDDGSVWVDQASYTGITGWASPFVERRFSVPN